MNVISKELTAQVVDPVRLAIIATGLQSIPDLIEADLMRTAFSPLVYEYKDYAVGMVDAEGRSIALATNGLPLFLTNLIGLAVRDGLAIYGADNIEEGDVLLTNHAATIGQHLNNVVMYTPIFGPSGKLLAFMSLIVHWIDIGGSYPGSASGTDMTELAQEGLQLRTVKLYKRGKPVEEIFRIIENNTRLPEMLLGDIAAQYAGCVKGKQLFEQLIARHGEDFLLTAISAMWSKAEQAAKAAVLAVPDGVYEMTSFLDDDGVDIGKRIPIHVKVEVRGSDFSVDFSGVGDQLRGPFNSGYYGGGEVCARSAFRYLFTPNEPANEGCFAPVKMILPPGKFLSAGPNAPMGRYSTPLATVVDTIIGAMAKALPDRVAAGHHGALDAYGFNGKHPATGKFFNYFDTAHGGWGGSSHGDGVGPYKSLLHGDNKDIPVETQESLYPVRVEHFGWREDSAGPGRHRGGLGIDKSYRVLAPCNSFIGFERHYCPPWGLNGGLSGTPAFVEIESKGERRKVLKQSRIPLQPGDMVHVHSGAGGGFGSPLERDAKAVQLDVARGYVSRAQASDVYGVVLSADGSIDDAETRALRNKKIEKS